MIRSCAKFILAGEHSIVYQDPCVVFPLPSAYTELKLNPRIQRAQLNGSDLGEPHNTMLKKLLELMRIPTSHADSLEIHSNIPTGSGLGSSASICVGLQRLFFPHKSAEQIAADATLGEALFHGKSSGVDTHAVSYERPLIFHNKNGYQVRELNTLAAKRDELFFVLRSTKSTHDTKNAVAAVEKLRQQNSAYFQENISLLSEVAKTSAEYFESGQWQKLSESIQQSQNALRNLGVSNEANETGIQSLLKQGALAAKLTGAGLGGYCLGMFKGQGAYTPQPFDFVLKF